MVVHSSNSSLTAEKSGFLRLSNFCNVIRILPQSKIDKFGRPQIDSELISGLVVSYMKDSINDGYKRLKTRHNSALYPNNM